MLGSSSVRGLNERVALVTNGAHGVGRAIAIQLSFTGAYVIVAHHDGDTAGSQVVAELRELGTLAYGLAVDISKAAGVARLFESVNEMFGRLDILVNVAGASEDIAFGDLSEDDWDRVIAADLKSAFLCAQAAVPLMKNRPSPAIVQIVGASGLAGRFGGAHYVAAHAGIIGLTKALARDLAAPRIRVNCVAVGRITEGIARQGASMPPPGTTRTPPDKANLIHAAPDEIARACLYLISPEARLINGQTITVGSEW
ncbi:MAG: SDR family NAD(P)-dependent oxidoreductase [Pyrinomonadaceae bacterium]